jgi:predicted nucleic acid-binding protein
MPVVLPDTGVWHALFDSRDPHFEDVGEKGKVLGSTQALLPWPVVYETLRTRFVRNRPALARFEA